MNLEILLGDLTPELIVKIVAFFLCGFGGMVAAYSYRWAQDKVPVSLWNYLTADRHEIGMAITKLIAACWVGGSFEYLESLDLNAIINAGVLLGMTIPDKVDADQAKHKQLEKDQKVKEKQNVQPVGDIE